eukprot:jgi/Bigna1/138670/aug1.46_g13378
MFVVAQRAEADDIADDLACFFGINIPDAVVDYKRNQVFREDDFPDVVTRLQEAQAEGRGAVATTSLVTVENSWYGIEAGFRCNVTWVYLSRASQWEDQLGADVRKLVTPKKNPDDPSSTPSHGMLKNFPNYGTFSQLRLKPPQANLLAELSTWVIHANQELFEAALS